MTTTLTIEQSQRLIELGVDPSKASDFYGHVALTEQGERIARHPIFTITDILSLLPREIRDTEIWETLYLTIETDRNNTWLATYRDYCGGEIVQEIGEKVAPELIDALFGLFVWVLKNHPDKIKKLCR